MTTDSPYVTLPLKAAADPDDIARTVLTLAECRSAIDIEIAGQTIRYYTDDHEVAAVLAPAALREAYPDTPSIGRLMLDSTLQYHQWQQARLAGQRAPGSVPADFVRQLHRTYLLLRSAALDLVAIQSPFDLHSTAQCTQETNRLRRLDHLPPLDEDEARHWLRDTYADWRSSGPHSWDCAGGCGGTAEVLQVLIWDADTLVPLHQESTRCDRGTPEQHTTDCECDGTGYTYEHGERHRCLGRTVSNILGLRTYNGR